MKVSIRRHVLLVALAIAVFFGYLKADQVVGDKKYTPKEIEEFNSKPQMKEFAKSEKQKSINFTFYAKVVDQHGNAVPNAEANFMLNYFDLFSLYFNGNKRFTVKADKNGLLKVKKNGRYLGLQDVKANGYEFIKHKQLAGKVYTPEKGYYPIQKNGKHVFPHSNPDDPAIIVIRKRGKAEYLTRESMHFLCRPGKPASKQFRVINRWVDPYGFHRKVISEEKNRLIAERRRKLERGVAVEKLPEKLKDIDLEYDFQISCSYPPDGKTWEVTLDFIGKDGGLYLSEGLLVKAPSAGYKKQIRISGTNPVVQTDYVYVQSKDKDIYSRIDMEIRTDSNSVFITGNIYTNPEGSRNLEYDESVIYPEIARRRKIAGRFIKIKKEAIAKYFEDKKRTEKPLCLI